MAEYNFTKKIGQPSLVNEGVYLVNAGRSDTANNELNGLGTYVADLERFSLGNWNSIVRNDPIFMSKLSVFTEYIENGRPVNVHYEPQAVLIYAIMEQYGQINTMIGDNGLIGDGNTGTAFDNFISSTGIDDTSGQGMTTAQYYDGLYGGFYLQQSFLKQDRLGTRTILKRIGEDPFRGLSFSTQILLHMAIVEHREYVLRMILEFPMI